MCMGGYKGNFLGQSPSDFDGDIKDPTSHTRSVECLTILQEFELYSCCKKFFTKYTLSQRWLDLLQRQHIFVFVWDDVVMKDPIWEWKRMVS